MLICSIGPKGALLQLPLLSGKKKFLYRGCGWSKRSPLARWSAEDRQWISVMISLFNKLFGGDFLKYVYDVDHGTRIAEESDPTKSFQYDHNTWEEHYADTHSHVFSEESTCTSWLKRVDEKGDQHGCAEDSDHESDESAHFVPISTPAPPQSRAESNPQRYQALRPTCPTSQSVKPTEQLIRSYSTTRSVLASISLPPVSGNLSLVCPLFHCSDGDLSDPFSLNKRPCESLLQEAEMQMSTSRSPLGEVPVALQIHGLGIFNEEGIICLKKMCTLSLLKRSVAAEVHWLDSRDGLSCEEQALLASFLWHKPPRDVICRDGQKMIDVEAFTHLALERYLDNMTIDVCISRYLAQAQTSERRSTLYLPFEVWTWVRALTSDQIQERLSAHLDGIDSTSLSEVLALVHFSNSAHWGLLFVDVVGKQLYFDDGYNSKPEPFVVEGLQIVLGVLKGIFPDHSQLQRSFWANSSTQDILRFGMDNQAIAASTTGHGSGSCGVGVIMAAKDFINNGAKAVNNQSWNYSQMQIIRKNLMLQIIEWGKGPNQTFLDLDSC